MSSSSFVFHIIGKKRLLPLSYLATLQRISSIVWKQSRIYIARALGTFKIFATISCQLGVDQIKRFLQKFAAFSRHKKKITNKSLTIKAQGPWHCYYMKNPALIRNSSLLQN